MNQLWACAHQGPGPLVAADGKRRPHRRSELHRGSPIVPEFGHNQVVFGIANRAPRLGRHAGLVAQADHDRRVAAGVCVTDRGS